MVSPRLLLLALLLLTGACGVLFVGATEHTSYPFVLENFIVKDRQGNVVADLLHDDVRSAGPPSSHGACREASSDDNDVPTCPASSMASSLSSRGTCREASSDDDVLACREWADGTSLRVHRQGDSCLEAELRASNRSLTSCFALGEGYWYGGGEEYVQRWPLNKYSGLELPLVTHSTSNRALVDPLWFSSRGQLVHLREGAPAFLQFNSTGPSGRRGPGWLCLRFAVEPPYRPRPAGSWVARFGVCSLGDGKRAFQHAVRAAIVARPTGHPDPRMVRHPVWSTWARYKADINDSVVRQFAKEIQENGFENSQLEIDDAWETCYGSKEVDPKRFPSLRNLTADLKRDGFRVTLWTHPFIQSDCTSTLAEAKSKGYLVEGLDGGTTTRWWNGRASIVDFTRPEAAAWFVAKHRALMEATGVDGFKFDAGETSWNPQLPRFHIRPEADEVYPNLATRKYVETCAGFGGISEVRTGYFTQSLPVFVRMIDKDSRWGEDNGLKSVVTTLLQMNMLGYSFVLPDMIGGNQYNGERATPELFVRWLQANAFMPAMQYALVPWDYGDKVVQIARKFNALHANYTDVIIKAMEKNMADGTPVNPPIWWIDPVDERAQTEDTEFLLGESVLVAPVLEKGATKRDVYLPRGLWRDANDRSKTYRGPTTVQDYPAPLDTLPWFVIVGSDSDFPQQ